MTAPFPTVIDYFSAWLDYRRWHLRTPGVQVAVRRHGELVLSQAFGTADLTRGTPLSTAHLFRIASHSKTFTAVAVLQLLEKGALRLDDTVADHVPELRGTPLAARTLRELLSHSGGVIRDSVDGDFWQLYRPFPDRAELLDIARRSDAAVLDRNTHYKYSNIAFGLVGLVIEAVTGQRFADVVRNCITEPLGLTDTGAELDPTRAGDYAAGHSSLATATRREVIEHVDTRALAAATGFYATAGDLTAFFSALLPGDTRLLSGDSQREMRRWQWQVKGDERGYGLGTFLDRIAGTELFGHTGGYPGHITCTYADGTDGWVVSVLTNAVDGEASALAGGFFRLLELGRHDDAVASGADATAFTGRFASLWGVMDVARISDRLFAVDPTADNPAEDAVPLQVVDSATLKIIGGRGGNSYGELMRYEFDDTGSVRSVRADSGMTMKPFTTPAD